MIDKFNRRLNMMIVSNEKSKAEGAKGTFLNNLYSYDAAGNITGVANSAALSAGIGGTMSHSYTQESGFLGFRQTRLSWQTASVLVPWRIQGKYDI